jgi:hypothetical protein
LPPARPAVGAERARPDHASVVRAASRTTWGQRGRNRRRHGAALALELAVREPQYAVAAADQRGVAVTVALEGVRVRW